MGLDNIDENELIMISIEQVENIEKWKSLFFELANRNITVVVAQEKIVTKGNFLNKIGLDNIQIICSAKQFIELVPKLKELDDDNMLSVKKTFQELEDFYYDKD